MRAPRKEIPKIRGTGIVCPALSLSLSLLTFSLNELYVDRHAVTDLSFAKNFFSEKKKKKEKLCPKKFTFGRCIKQN